MRAKFITFIITSIMFSLSLSSAYAKTLTLSTGVSETASVRIAAELVVRNALANMGISLVVETYPQKRSLMRSEQGLNDGQLFRVDTVNDNMAFKHLIQVKSKVIDNSFLILSSDKNRNIHEWADFNPEDVVHYTAGIQVVKMNLETRLNTGNLVEIYQSISPKTLLYALQNKMIDFVILPTNEKCLGRYEPELFNPYMLDNRLKHDLFIWLHKKHSAMIPELEKQINLVNNSSEIHSQINKIKSCM